MGEPLADAARRLSRSVPTITRHLREGICFRDENGVITYAGPDFQIKIERIKKLQLENAKLERALETDRDHLKDETRLAFKHCVAAIRSRVEGLPFKLSNDPKFQNRMFIEIRKILEGEVGNLKKVLEVAQ